MNAVLFLILVIILGAALWPKSTYGRSQHHRLRDKQPPAYEIKAFHHEALQKAAVKLKALDAPPIPEALQKAAVKLKALDVPPTPEASQKAAVKLYDSDSETYDVIRELEERWIARHKLHRAESQQEEGDDNGADNSEKALIL